MMRRYLLVAITLILVFFLSSCCGTGNVFYGKLYIINPCLSTDFEGKVELVPFLLGSNGDVEGIDKVYKIESCGITSIIQDCKKEIDLIWDEAYGSAITVEVKIWREEKSEEQPIFQKKVVVKGTTNSCSSSGTEIEIPRKYCKLHLF